MSYTIRIFCQATKSLTRRELQELILGGLHFDRQPVFIPAFLDPDSMAEDWQRLVIIYEPDVPTVNLMRYVDDQLFYAERDAVRAVMTQSLPQDAQLSLIEILDSCSQLLVIEINRDTLSEDAWSMLDSLEAYLAGNLRGLVYAPEDGFYGSGLQLLYKIA